MTARLSAALRRDLAAVIDGTCTEAQFQRVIVKYAKDHGWLVHHTPKAKVRPGRHVTPTVGHVGYPDLTLCRGGRLVLLELKSRRGTTTPSQDLWRDRLEQVPGVEYHVLWPEAWPHKVTRVLV